MFWFTKSGVGLRELYVIQELLIHWKQYSTRQRKRNKGKLVQWGSVRQVWSGYLRHQNQLKGLIKYVLGSFAESTVFASLGVRSGQVHVSKVPQWFWCPAELNFYLKGTTNGYLSRVQQNHWPLHQALWGPRGKGHGPQKPALLSWRHPPNGEDKEQTSLC